MIFFFISGYSCSNTNSEKDSLFSIDCYVLNEFAILWKYSLSWKSILSDIIIETLIFLCYEFYAFFTPSFLGLSISY